MTAAREWGCNPDALTGYGARALAKSHEEAPGVRRLLTFIVYLLAASNSPENPAAPKNVDKRRAFREYWDNVRKMVPELFPPEKSVDESVDDWGAFG